MHKIVKVEFPFSENHRFQRMYQNPGPSFKTIEEANAFLRFIAHESPTKGYDKTDFRTVWEDGEVYEGRYDLHHIDQNQENPNGRIDLADHIRAWVRFLTGDHCPAHMTQERYQLCLQQMGDHSEEARRFLELYELA